MASDKENKAVKRRAKAAPGKNKPQPAKRTAIKSTAKAAPGKSKPRAQAAKQPAKRTAIKSTVKAAPGKSKPRAPKRSAVMPSAKAAPGRTKPRAQARPVRRPKNARARREQNCWWALPVSCLMILLLAATALLAIREVGESRRFRVMRQAVDTEGYYSGIVVENYDVSGWSYANALKYWADEIEPLYKDRVLTLTYNGQSWSTTPQALGYSSDYEQVLKSAWTRGRAGTLEQRYRSIKLIRNTVERFPVARTLFDEAQLREWTDGIARSLTEEPVSAQVTGFDVDTLTFAFSESKTGYGVDSDALYARARSLIMNAGGAMAIDVAAIPPEVSTADLKGRFGLITPAVTNASSSNSNRLTNLRLACAAINGYCVKPGGTFSFNEVVGQRTSKKGYKKATVYQSGEVAEDIGGGVCQVSTTLWNAAMKANCEIVERHEHSRPVAYVDRGKDATVNWDNQDMKFKNTSDYPMYLVCYVTSDKRVHCDIYGELFPDGRYITIEGKTTRTIKPEDPVYTYNPLFLPGQTAVLTEARTGYRASAYRVYWDGNGNELKRELLCESYYKPARALVEYG